MCIIIVKNKEVNLPKFDVFRTCWKNNPHGAGMMYTIDNYVYIEKGFMKFEEFINRIKELKNEIDIYNTPIVFHFRISTSGKIDEGNTHPYPLTNEESLLRKTMIKTSLGIAHNGIIHRYNRANEILNDTQLFIMNDLYTLYKLNKNFYKYTSVHHIVQCLIDKSRLCILDKNGNIITIGHWIESDGLYFSNDKFKEVKMKYVYDYHDYYEEYGNEEERFFIDMLEVTEDEFYDLFDTLELLEDNRVVISDDLFYEYRGENNEYYLDEINKKIYILEEYNTLIYLGRYLTIDDLY